MHTKQSGNEIFSWIIVIMEPFTCFMVSERNRKRKRELTIEKKKNLYNFWHVDSLQWKNLVFSCICCWEFPILGNLTSTVWSMRRYDDKRKKKKKKNCVCVNLTVYLIHNYTRHIHTKKKKIQIIKEEDTLNHYNVYQRRN